MVRDMELMRQIMLNVQADDLRSGVGGYDDDVVNYHKAQLIDEGLLVGFANYPTGKDAVPGIPDLVVINRITPSGHNWIAAIATDTRWNQVKGFVTSAGKVLTIKTIKWGVSQMSEHQHQMKSSPVAVFVSHTSSEATIVNHLVEYLRVALPDIEFYVSSSYQSLKPGASWWDDIRSTLSDAKVILACISRQSINKPWILFETGVGLGCGAVVIPVILDDLPDSQVGPPLSMYQAVRMERHSLKHLAASIGENTRTRVHTNRLQRKRVPEFGELNVSAGTPAGIYCGNKHAGVGGWQRYDGNPNSYRESSAYVSIGNSFDDGFRYPPSDSLDAPFHFWGFRIKPTHGVHIYAAVKCANGRTYKVYVNSDANGWGFISDPTNEFVVPGSVIPNNTWQIVIVNISSLENKFESPIRAIVGFRARGPLMLSHVWCVDKLAQIPRALTKKAIHLVYPGE
jgi:hypothetical protein